MTTRKQVLLLSSACAMVILLAGMVIILSATTTEEPASAGIATTLATIVWWVIGVIGALLILTLIAAGSFAMMKKRRVTEEPGRERVTGSGTEAKGKVRATAGTARVIGGAILLLVGAAYLLPAFWEWWRNQGFLFWWTVLALPALVAAAVKFKYAWWLVIIGVVIAFLAADRATFPNPLDWREPNLATVNAAAAKRQAVRVASAEKSATAHSRVTTKTIVARPKPDKLKRFMPNVILPFWHKCDWSLSDGCVKVENGRGESIISCRGQRPTGELSASNQLAFWSLELEKEVIVSIVCEPE